jgi:signal transduction histidine kinase
MISRLHIGLFPSQTEAGVFQRILLTFFALCLIVIFFVSPLIIFPDVAVAVSTIVSIVIAICWFLTRAGKMQLAKNLIIGSSIVCVCGALWFMTRNGLSFLPSILLCIIAVSGALVSPRMIIFATVLSSLNILALGIWMYSGWETRGIAQENLTGLFAYLLLFVGAGASLALLKGHLNRVQFDSDRHKQALVQQIQERERAQLLADDRARELGAVFDISNALGSTIEQRAYIDGLFEHLRRIVQFDAYAILDYAKERGTHVLAADGTPPFLKLLEAIPVHILDTVASRLSFERGQFEPLIYSDMRTCLERELPLSDDANAMVRLLPQQFGASTIVAPLIARGKAYGSVIVFSQTPSAFQGNARQLIQTVAASLSAAIERSRLYEQSIASAALSERSRIARELHDSVSQMLFAILLGVRTMAHQHTAGQAPTREQIEYMQTLAEGALNDTRSLVFELRPEYIEREGLLAALNKQLTTLGLRHQKQIHTQLLTSEPKLPIKTKESLYRIAVEATQNALKHADALQIDVIMSSSDGKFSIEIKDNGRGFDTHARYDGHYGLLTMRERVETIGGTLSIESTPGHGTTVRVAVHAAASP